MSAPRRAPSSIADGRVMSTRSNSATTAALPPVVDPLTITMRELRVVGRDASGSRTRPRNEISRSRSPSFEETADTTPFDLVDPANPAATLRDIPAATGMSCRRRTQLALVASFVLALAGYITTAV